MRSIPPVTACGGGDGRKQQRVSGGINKLIQNLPGMIEKLQEVQQRVEEARGRGEDPRPVVQSSLGGHVLGQRIGSIPPGGRSSSQYGDDPRQHTDEYGAGYGRNRGIGAGGVRPTNKRPSPAEKEITIPDEGVLDPRAEVLDNEIIAEMPGVSESEVIVTSKDGMLTIGGKSEYREYTGTVELPADKAVGKHTLNNGVLVVTLKRKRPRKKKED